MQNPDVAPRIEIEEEIAEPAPGAEFEAGASAAHPNVWVEVNPEALRRNFSRFAAAFDPEVQIIVSVKKDAYGHGLAETARLLAGEPRLAGFGVFTVAEARALRVAGIVRPVMCFTVLRGEELREAIDLGMTLTITDAHDAKEASEAAAASDKAAEAHLKIDTGLGRLGVTPVEALGSVSAIRALPSLRLTSLYTHFADAWADPAGAREQLRKLDEFAAAAGLGALPRHIGGSDALSLRGEFRRGTVRAGIAIYGYHPALAELQPAMTVKSRVIFRRRAAAGTKISYGGTYALQRDSELALVAAGYGNGYPLSLSNRGKVLIRGSRCPVLGRVCMDQVVVDATDCPDVSVDDEVILIGKSDQGSIGAEEVAEWAKTIPYELLCVLGQINPRLHTSNSSA